MDTTYLNGNTSYFSGIDVSAPYDTSFLLPHAFTADRGMPQKAERILQ